MRALSRVVWSEGMHLAQHHFQAQSRYFEELTDFVVGSLFFRPYGVAGLGLDAEALLNGMVVLTHARGLMPDGLAFHFPADAPPEPLDVRELFSPTQESHLLLLAVPAFRAGHANCELEAGAAAGALRYRAVPQPMLDEVTGLDEQPVTVARKGFRLLLDAQPHDGLVTLPLARVRRDGSGHFVYDPAYVPPCLQIGASERLLQLLARLTEVLDGKAAALQAERRGRGDAADYAAREIAGFWLSHAIHASLAPLRHHLHARSTHPEALYRELARLAGALCTFSLESHPRDLPLYDHDRLEDCFDALERHVRQHLELLLPTRCVRIALQRGNEFYFTGTVQDRRCFGRAHWFLGVRSGAGPGEVVGRVPKLVKLCSAEHIAKLVERAHAGLPLTHVPVPPPELSPRVATQYFAIERLAPGTGQPHPCWRLMEASSGIGVYVPAALPDAELEVLVVLEG